MSAVLEPGARVAARPLDENCWRWSAAAAEALTPKFALQRRPWPPRWNSLAARPPLVVVRARSGALAPLLALGNAAPERAPRVHPALKGAQGVGTDTAAILLVAAGKNPQRFKNEAAFAALCEVSPVQASSGKSQRHRLNRSGNRQANHAL